MTYPRFVRWLFRLGLAGFLSVLALFGAQVAVIVWPGVLFPVARSGGVVTFHSQTALPPEAERMAEQVTALLVHSPLGVPDAVDVWLVEDGLPLRVFFAGSPRASGLTYPIASVDNVFLRHADFDRNRLVLGGDVVPPPRTLSYYLVHEITHLQLARIAGRWAVPRIPRWINEGFADYVALGPAPPAMVARADAGLPLPRALFGSYPRERVCVTLALERLGGDLEALLAMRDEMGADGACPLVAQFGIAPAGTGT